MNATQNVTIPYERHSETGRTCGAACLSMVYRSFGKEVSQTQIWPSIAKPNRAGNLSSTTHLMARDALSRGFSAMAIQARNPLQALRLCCDSGVRAILNHRLKQDVTTGHYTVLVDIDDKNVVVHDPFYGPSRRLSHAELLELWQPRFPSEIVGYVLIGVAAQPPAVPACQLCRTPIPSNVECPKCKKPVGLQPAALMGCMSGDCMARMWNYICCPSCDFMWTFSIRPPQAGASASGFSNGPSRPDHLGPLSPGTPAASAFEQPLNLDRLFSELDKFCSHILSLPAATNHPEIKQQLNFITTSKEKLKLAQAEELAHRKARQEQLAELVQAANQNEEAHRKRLEELNTPSPPLDGNALGRALLKNLGLID